MLSLMKDKLFGLTIVEDESLTDPLLILPTHPFIEYEESDASWLLYTGEARIIQVPSKRIYFMEDYVVMHPVTAKLAIRELERRIRKTEMLFQLQDSLYPPFKNYLD